MCPSLRESWRPKNVSMKPNSSPPKKKKNIRWTRWLWSWSSNGLKHSGVCVCTGLDVFVGTKN